MEGDGDEGKYVFPPKVLQVAGIGQLSKEVSGCYGLVYALRSILRVRAALPADATRHIACNLRTSQNLMRNLKFFLAFPRAADDGGLAADVFLYGGRGEWGSSLEMKAFRLGGPVLDSLRVETQIQDEIRELEETVYRRSDGISAFLRPESRQVNGRTMVTRTFWDASGYICNSGYGDTPKISQGFTLL